MRTKKVIIITICCVMAIICLGFVGLRSFVISIYQSQNCEWANIDNIEMRAMVDVPKIESSECEYDSIDKTKKAVFVLDKHLNIQEYIAKNKLTKLSEAEKLASFDLIPEEIEATETYYFREKTTERESYKILLDSKSRKLWIDLKYLD